MVISRVLHGYLKVGAQVGGSRCITKLTKFSQIRFLSEYYEDNIL